MKSKTKLAALLLLALSLLACRFLFPEATPASPLPPTATLRPTSTQAAAPRPTASPTALESSNLPDPEPLVIVALDPVEGNLETQLQQHAQKALERGMLPVVEFDAEW